MDSQSKIKKIGRSYILYDASIIADPDVQLFDADYHTKRESQQSNLALNEVNAGVGRAKVVYFSLESEENKSENKSENKTEKKQMVLKHYYRGGAVASISKDNYLGVSVIKSRSFREWRLLKKLYDLGLPVPVAVAAHVKKGWLSYRADLITEKIEDSKTLIDVLIEKSLTKVQWKSIGDCIKQFHQNNVYHTDLNARNILLTNSGGVYLIDFDNSAFRLDSKTWKMSNLSRLKRSLLKFKKGGICHFEEDNWTALLEGYNNG